MSAKHRPITLIVLDGWGYRAETEANAIAAAHTPHWDQFWSDCPHTLISGSGHHVGLPAGQMGNSEVGHLNMGAGRVVYQEFSRIEKAIADGEFDQNAVFFLLAEKCHPSYIRTVAVFLGPEIGPVKLSDFSVVNANLRSSLPIPVRFERAATIPADLFHVF